MHAVMSNKSTQFIIMGSHAKIKFSALDWNVECVHNSIEKDTFKQEKIDRN